MVLLSLYIQKHTSDFDDFAHMLTLERLRGFSEGTKSMGGVISTLHWKSVFNKKNIG